MRRVPLNPEPQLRGGETRGSMPAPNPTEVPLSRANRLADLAAGVVALTAVSAVSMHAGAAVESTFNVGSEGWVAVDLPWPDPGSPPTALATWLPDYLASGGNPGGHLSLEDPSSGPLFYWRAPAKFLGDRSDAYNQSISFDLASVGSSVFVDQEDVILVGAGITLTYQTFVYPGPAFTPYSISLNESGWHLDNTLTGTPATAADMQAVLGSLSALYIRGEYLDGGVEIGLLDNVVLASNLPSDIIFVSGFEF